MNDWKRSTPWLAEARDALCRAAGRDTEPKPEPARVYAQPQRRQPLLRANSRLAARLRDRQG